MLSTINKLFIFLPRRFHSRAGVLNSSGKFARLDRSNGLGVALGVSETIGRVVTHVRDLVEKEPLLLENKGPRGRVGQAETMAQAIGSSVRGPEAFERRNARCARSAFMTASAKRTWPRRVG